MCSGVTVRKRLRDFRVLDLDLTSDLCPFNLQHVWSGDRGTVEQYFGLLVNRIILKHKPLDYMSPADI